MYEESQRNRTIRMCREKGWRILLTCRTYGGGSHAMIGWLALTDYPPNMTMEQLAERATFSKCEPDPRQGTQCLGRTFFKALVPGGPGWSFLGRELPRPRRPGHGPQSRGKGPFVGPEEVEPPAVTTARGPAPPEPEESW